MAIFLELYLGHLIGDFLLQPGRLVAAKRDGAGGLILHTLIVGASTALVMIGTLRADWPLVLAVTGLHLVIERITITTYLKTRTRGLFTFLMDQAMHALSIALVVSLAGRWSTAESGTLFGFAISTVDLAMVCALATVTVSGSIFVFEMANAVLGETKGRLLRLDGPRVYGIVERGGALALMVVHPALVFLPFVPRVCWALTRGRDGRARNMVEAGAGLVLSVLGFAGVTAVGYLTQVPPGTGFMGL